MTTKAAASIIADRLGSALNLPRRSKPPIEGGNFGIALSEARSAERRSNTASERAEEKVTPEPRETGKPTRQRDEQNAVDNSASSSTQDKAVEQAENHTVSEPDAPVSNENQSESVNETVNSDETETAETPVAENDGSSSQADGTREGQVESSGTVDITQAVSAEVTVSSDALLLKALEVGVNAGQTLRNDSNGQTVPQEPSSFPASGQAESTAQVTFDRNAFTGNTGSESGQEQRNPETDQRNEQTAQVQHADATSDLNFDTEDTPGQSSGKNQQSVEPIVRSSRQTDVPPQVSLQDIKATILEPRGPQQVKSNESFQANSEQVTQPSATGKHPTAPREFNLANELAKAILPDRPADSSGSTQGSTFSTAEADASSNPTGQNAGGGVSAPQGVRVIASSGPAGQAAPAAFGVDASSDKGTIEQIVRVTQASTHQQTSHVRLQLDPPELGQLRIDVKAHQGNLSLQIEADTQAVKSILESRMGELRNALQREGIHVERFDIEVKITHQSHNENSQEKTSDGNPSGRETNPQDQANERSGGRRGAGTEDDSSLTDLVEGPGFEDTESDAALEQSAFSGFDVTA